jgi:hypothetical protein
MLNHNATLPLRTQFTESLALKGCPLQVWVCKIVYKINIHHTTYDLICRSKSEEFRSLLLLNSYLLFQNIMTVNIKLLVHLQGNRLCKPKGNISVAFYKLYAFGDSMKNM